MTKKQNQLWTWATLGLILATLSALCFAGCTYESKTKVAVDGGNPWTYMWDYENRLKQASKSGGVVEKGEIGRTPHFTGVNLQRHFQRRLRLNLLTLTF